MTSLRGTLNSVDLANIFQMLSLNQREGTLYISDGLSRKAIYFGQEGVSMLSRGKGRPDTLGRILLRYDHISEEHLQSALHPRVEAVPAHVPGDGCRRQGEVDRALVATIHPDHGHDWTGVGWGHQHRTRGRAQRGDPHQRVLHPRRPVAVSS